MSRRGENIRKRKDGRWEGRYIKGYDSKKQKARYASVYGKTYAETKQKLDEAKYKSSIGVVYVDAKNKLFGEIINSWFNAKKINLKPSSIIKYQNLIEKHILPELGHRKLRELNADLFYTFLDAQQKNGNKKNGGMLSTSSLQTMLYILNATIKYAASNNMVAYFSICLTRSGKEATPIQTLIFCLMQAMNQKKLKKNVKRISNKQFGTSGKWCFRSSFDVRFIRCLYFKAPTKTSFHCAYCLCKCTRLYRSCHKSAF